MELRQCLSALGRLKHVNNEIEKPNYSKKIMIKLSNKTFLGIAALFCAIFLLAACSSEEITPATPGGNASKVLTTFVAGTPATNDTPTTSSSRHTSMDYTTGNFFWEEGDRIFVKDDTASGNGAAMQSMLLMPIRCVRIQSTRNVHSQQYI